MIKRRIGLSLVLAAGFAARGESQTLIDLRTQSKSVDFSGAGSTKPMSMGSSLPATCAPGQFFFLTSAPAGNNVYACNPANVWTQEGASLAVDPSTTNKVVSSNGTSIQWFALGGDISGAPNGITVSKLQGRSLGSTAPADGQVLKWNAASSQWLPAPGQTGNSSYVFISQVSLTIPGTVHQLATANLIADCYDSSTPPKRVEADSIQVNTVTFDVTINFSTAQSGYCVLNGGGTPGGGVGGGTITPVGGDLTGNTAAATVKGLQSRAVASTAPSDGQALVWSAASAAWKPGTSTGGGVTSVFGRTGTVTAQSGDYSFGLISGTVGSGQAPLSGDLSGNTVGATVTGLQNRPVASTAPADGQSLVWSAANGNWRPSTVSGGGGAVTSVFGRTGAVTAQTGDYSFGQLSGTVGSGQLPGAGGDLSGGLTTATVSGLQNRPVASTAPSDGQSLVWSAANGNWRPSTVSGGGGAVTSVFGRTGAVTAQTGDYSFGQISGTVGSGQAPVSGDLSGNTVGATVTGLQTRPLANTAPVDGQALLWSATAGKWQPGTVSGGGGGGATMASQLGDLAVVLSSSTTLSIGTNCATATPCNVRFGTQTYRFTNSASVTISGGSGTAFVYVNGAGAIVVGHNLTVSSCSGCTAQSGVTAFPANVLPIYTWTASNGTWDSTGGRDQRAFLSGKALVGGLGIVISEAPGQSTITVDNGVIPVYLTSTASLSFPSISNGTCAADLTITVTGANAGDAVAPGWPVLPAGLLGTMLVSSTNTVSVRLCNFSGAGLTPPNTTYRATIVRNY
jgi:hypothetical protein